MTLIAKPCVVIHCYMNPIDAILRGSCVQTAGSPRSAPRPHRRESMIAASMRRRTDDVVAIGLQSHDGIRPVRAVYVIRPPRSVSTTSMPWARYHSSPLALASSLRRHVCKPEDARSAGACPRRGRRAGARHLSLHLERLPVRHEASPVAPDLSHRSHVDHCSRRAFTAPGSGPPRRVHARVNDRQVTIVRIAIESPRALTTPGAARRFETGSHLVG